MSSKSEASKPTIIVLITGHPATGKTTLAHKLALDLQLPLIWKDGIKETLLDNLGTSNDVWSRTLSKATWELLYQQVESLLKGKVSFVIEGNFDPKFANNKWQALADNYQFQLIQLRCETDPAILINRYIARIKSRERHAGHVDDSKNRAFLDSIHQPYGWVGLDSKRISLNTNQIETVNYKKISSDLQTLFAIQI